MIVRHGGYAARRPTYYVNVKPFEKFCWSNITFHVITTSRRKTLRTYLSMPSQCLTDTTCRVVNKGRLTELQFERWCMSSVHLSMMVRRSCPSKSTPPLSPCAEAHKFDEDKCVSHCGISLDGRRHGASRQGQPQSYCSSPCEQRTTDTEAVARHRSVEAKRYGFK